MHERIYSPIICWFRCKYLFAEYNSLVKFLSAGKSEGLQRLTPYESLARNLQKERGCCTLRWSFLGCFLSSLLQVTSADLWDPLSRASIY
jgi:hypothetical protein